VQSNTLRRKRTTLVTNTRWAAYATAGAASTFAATQSAHADITHVTENRSFSDTNPSASIADIGSFNLGGAASFYLVHNIGSVPGAGFAGFFIGAANTAAFAGVIGATNTHFRYPLKLASNVLVSAQVFVANFPGRFATLVSAGGYVLSQWKTSGTGYLAFKFDAGAGTQYGWAQIRMDSGTPLNTFTLIDYAYADPGEMIRTGEFEQVPEAGSLGLLAIGAVGLLAWRHQRSKTAAKA
jgi:hypothetical protein